MAYTLSEDYDYYLDVLLFKIIKVKPKSVIEKEKTIYLYLTEPTNLLKKVSESFANQFVKIINIQYNLNSKGN